MWEASKVRSFTVLAHSVLFPQIPQGPAWPQILTNTPTQFWKQFFEASANVSLSGYEELAGDDETTTAAETTVAESTADDDYTVTQDHGNDDRNEDDSTADQSGYQNQRQQRGDVEESLLDDAEMTGSTPRAPTSKSIGSQQRQRQQQQQHVVDFESPYEKLRRELKNSGGDGDDNTAILAGGEGGNAHGGGDDDDTMELPTHATTTAATRLPDMSMTGRSSSLLFDDPTMQQRLQSPERKNKDPLLHHVLNKNYRIQATPHKGAPTLSAAGRGLGLSLSPEKDRHRHRDRDRDGGGGGGGGDESDRTRRALWADSPMSSPEMAIPKLRSDLYMSPAKAARGRRVQAGRAAAEPPRTPGVSVQTPGTARKTRDVFAEERTAGKGKEKARDEITWESDSGGGEDEDEDTGAVLFGGMSPPKTIQFALPPSKLMQTPAREASRRIVEDILISAGARPEGGGAGEESSEYSPTLVKMNKDILDDTF